MAFGIFVPHSGIELGPPAVEMQSPNQGMLTSRDFKAEAAMFPAQRR